MKKGLFIVLLIVVLGGLTIIFWPKPTVVQVGNKDVKTEIDVITGLNTCDICGYDALEVKGAACFNCAFAINDEIIAAEGLDKKSFLIMKQMEFFMPDTIATPIDFLNPLVSDKGYPKNTNWRPSVSEYEIFEFQKMMLQIEASADSTLIVNDSL